MEQQVEIIYLGELCMAMRAFNAANGNGFKWRNENVGNIDVFVYPSNGGWKGEVIFSTLRCKFMRSCIIFTSNSRGKTFPKIWKDLNKVYSDLFQNEVKSFQIRTG